MVNDNNDNLRFAITSHIKWGINGKKEKTCLT